MKEYIRILRKGLGRGNIGAPLILVLILGMIIAPLPPIALDMLFILNIVISISILMTCVFAKKPLEFSVFPTVLLVATMMRLSLNIASTRVILLYGQNGTGGAGQVIEAFGNIVIGGNLVVGVIVFAILTIINFVVITKGAERISEVGARFTLDSLPGKQMAIDADLAAGSLTQEEASARRTELSMESQFHGNMDGASKFVKGDAIAGIMILFINLIAGLVVGITQHGMEASQAAETFLILSIGDGLVAIIPSIVIALSTAIIVTRVGGNVDLGEVVNEQLLTNHKVPLVTGLIMLALGLIPSMPHLLLICVSSLLFFFSYKLKKKYDNKLLNQAIEAEEVVDEPKLKNSNEIGYDDLTEFAPIKLVVGYSISDLVKGESSPLMEAIRGVRKDLSKEYGVVIKGFHILDSPDVETNQYQIYISGILKGEGHVYSKLNMAISPDPLIPPLSGEKGVEPVFGINGYWIINEDVKEAEELGYTVIEPANMIATHIEQCLTNNLEKMIDVDDAQIMIDKIAEKKPKLIESSIKNNNSLLTYLEVCRSLLEERAPINQSSIILETMAMYSETNISHSSLLSMVRLKLGPWIIKNIIGDKNKVKVITFDESLENLMNSSMQQDGSIFLPSEKLKKIIDSLNKNCKIISDYNCSPILMVNPLLRYGVYKLFSGHIPELYVIDFLEIPKDMNVEIISQIS